MDALPWTFAMASPQPCVRYSLQTSAGLNDDGSSEKALRRKYRPRHLSFRLCKSCLTSEIKLKHWQDKKHKIGPRTYHFLTTRLLYSNAIIVNLFVVHLHAWQQFVNELLTDLFVTFLPQQTSGRSKNTYTPQETIKFSFTSLELKISSFAVLTAKPTCSVEGWVAVTTAVA
jgi:hypothetical protein